MQGETFSPFSCFLLKSFATELGIVHVDPAAPYILLLDKYGHPVVSCSHHSLPLHLHSKTCRLSILNSPERKFQHALERGDLNCSILGPNAEDAIASVMNRAWDLSF